MYGRMKGGKGDRNKEGKEEAYSVCVWGGGRREVQSLERTKSNRKKKKDTKLAAEWGVYKSQLHYLLLFLVLLRPYSTQSLS